jgi:hypothetical protein
LFSLISSLFKLKLCTTPCFWRSLRAYLYILTLIRSTNDLNTRENKQN